MMAYEAVKGTLRPQSLQPIETAFIDSYMNTLLSSFGVVIMLGIISSMHHRDRRSLHEIKEYESACLETGLLLAENKCQYSNTKL